MAIRYHPGARQVQARAGVEDRAATLLRAVRTTVPDAAIGFLADRSTVVVGAADGAGRMWATVLTGPPGFLDAPDPSTPTVAARPAPTDPLATALAGQTTVGLLVLDTVRRRRMRLLGTAEPAAGGLRVRLDQVFANCPKYIQRRTPLPDAPPATPTTRLGTALTPDQQRTLSGADTFFIVTAAEGRTDTSHRGGDPGFLRVLGPTRLRWPDHPGNDMFLTLGNLARQPRAGLVLPGWETGSLLQLTGSATTVWGDGPERWVEFEVDQVVETAGATAQRWSRPEFSPANPPVDRR